MWSPAMKDPLGVGPSKGNHIDPHSQKEHTEIHKIPKFVVNQDSCAEIQRFKNVKINKEMYGHPDAVRTQHPDGHLFLCKVWHFQMAVSYLLVGLFTPNLGILWSLVYTLWLCGSIVANPIIYRLVPSPSRFENRQWVSISMHACDPVPIVMGLRLAALRATGGAPR